MSPARRRGLWIALGTVLLAGAGGILLHGSGGRAATTTPSAAPPPMSFDPNRVGFEGRARVEVLNAAGRAGLARAVTQRLRALGFDVVYYGNGKTFGRDSSVVLARTADTTAAQRVADALGISRVVRKPDPDLLLDVSVVLGKDWTPPSAKPDSALPWPIRLWRRLTRSER